MARNCSKASFIWGKCTAGLLGQLPGVSQEVAQGGGPAVKILCCFEEPGGWGGSVVDSEALHRGIAL